LQAEAVLQRSWRLCLCSQPAPLQNGFRLQADPQCLVLPLHINTQKAHIHQRPASIARRRWLSPEQETPRLKLPLCNLDLVLGDDSVFCKNPSELQRKIQSGYLQWFVLVPAAEARY
jgi:hypothetical protein